MGGRVARYALECLGLWRSARALITFGTPYRGAPRALDYLVNGRALRAFGVRWLEVTDVLHSFPSAYQLLPRYPAIETREGVRRVSEVGAAALGLDPALLHRHAELHRALDAAVARNAEDAAYRASPYRTFPVIGYGQPTLLGSQWLDGVLTSSADRPHWLPAEMPDGDGTVPRLSALPLDQSGPGEFRGLFVAQAHESLQGDDAVLADLVARLEYLQAPDLAPFRGGAEAERTGALGVSLADATPAGRPIEIRARAVGAPAGAGPALEALVAPAGGGTGAVVVPLAPRDDGWAAGEAPGRAPGFYRATVRAVGTARARFGAVTSGFAVVEAEPGADGA
jgi:hypothetical protein